MRRPFSNIMSSLLVAIAVSMVFPFYAGDKKDDKKGGKDDEDKGHEPVLIIVWEDAWKPVYRAVSLSDVMVFCPTITEEL